MRLRFTGISTVLLFAVLLLSSRVVAQHATVSPAFDTAAGEAKRFQLASGLKLEVWAAEPQLSNSVAFAFDGRGRVYLAESDRWAISVFDITQHTNWLWQDMASRSVADRGAFLTNQFATNLAFLTRDSEVIRRLEDRDGDGKADQSEIIASGFTNAVDGTAAGVLATREGIYFANIPSLWKLALREDGPPSPRPSPPGRGGDARPAKDSTNTTPLALGAPAPADSRSPLATGFGVHIGVSGHDLHGLIKGPDGRIYMSFGDRGCVLTNREEVVINLPDTGGVLRCEPDGRNLEVFCFGLRNPQELAFDDLGNLWTVDNDTAGADPCRVLHLVEGGDYGWRTSYQHMEGFGPWVQEELWKGGQDGILPPAGTVSQGPSGLACYPGTGFGERLAGTFLHADFPGGVTAFTVKPQGASYVVDRKEKFLWNCWPTDVDFGPDGAAYVLDWVSGWGQTPRGRIYRVTPTVPLEAREIALVAETKRLLAEGMSNRSEKELLELLGHTDRRVRLEAQWELAGRGLPVLAALDEVAEDGRSQTQRLHALWAIGQIARSVSEYSNPSELSRSIVRLLHLVEDNDRVIAAAAAQGLAAAKSMEGMEAMTPLLTDPDLQVRRKAGLALATMPFGRGMRTQPRALDPIVQKINRPWVTQFIQQKFPRYTHWVGPLKSAELVTANAADDPFLRHIARLLLQEGVAMGPFYDDQLALAATNASPPLRVAALQAQSRLAERARDMISVWPNFPHFHTNAAAISTRITNFLTDPDPRLIVAAGRAIHDLPVVEGFPALASFITKIDCPTNLMSRVIDACYRLGTQQHAQMVAGFAAREDVPDWARVLAVRALAEWEKPAPLDRVNGLWRPLVATKADENRKTGKQENERSPSPGEAGRDRSELSSRNANPPNSLLERAAQSQATRNLGRAAELPVLPADLGRSVPYDEAMALRRNPAPAQRAFLRVAADLMNPFNLNEAGHPAGTREVLPLQIAVAESAAKLRVKEAGTPLFEKFTHSNTPPELRRAILPALAELRSPLTGEAVKLALANSDVQLRATALPYLDRLEGDSVELLVSLVGLPPKAGNAPNIPLAQAALGALARLSDAKADQAVRTALVQLEAGQLPPELAIDVREAARARGMAPPKAVGSELMVGGNAERGRLVFFNNQTVQCLRCHKVGPDGGTVGPDLASIGKRQARDYIFESIVQPNAKVAAGFENVVLTLTDGSSLAGSLKSEGDTELSIEVAGDDGIPTLTKVAKARIQQRQRGPSAMPEGLADQLTPFELRDLVEYLATLK